jgi:hypothetical protein
MGMRQMTFDIPEEIAEQFCSDVPASERSAYVTKKLQRPASRLSLTEEQWDAAAKAANADEQLNADIEEWQAFSDPIEEPWNAPSPR